MKEILLYNGENFLGDFNKYAKSRKLTETLKSESDSPSADQLSFDINWSNFKEIIAIRYSDNPDSILRVGKTTVVFKVDGKIRFSGWLAARPARSGFGQNQTLSLVFYEWFARLSGDLVTYQYSSGSPYRAFSNTPAHEYAKDLINEFLGRARDAGETLNWTFGKVDSMSNKSITYKDFQTVSKALCDAMNNVSGHGKFDIVIHTDEENHTHQIVDILKPRGKRKNIIIQYPADGVYELWSTDYSLEETNDYASDVLIAGNGQVGQYSTGEMTANLGKAKNSEFVENYCYWRIYKTQSNLVSQDAVDEFAKSELAKLDFTTRTPEIKLVGRPIAWGDADNENTGLAVGDTFYLEDANDDGADNSGFMRIISMETEYDDNGVETVVPKLLRVDD